MNSLKKFWHNRRVLVTGHDGFKGSWLSLILTRLGAKVFGFSSGESSGDSLFYFCGLDSKVQSLKGDVRDYKQVSEMLRTFQPEVVFHLAAQSLVPESFRNPLATLQINVYGTLNVLEAIRVSSSVQAVIIASSDKCYASNGVSRPHIETDALGGDDPYSASKACTEIIAQCYQSSFFSNRSDPQDTTTFPLVATVRAGNVLGGGDWAKDRLIPDCVRSIVANEKLHLRNPSYQRPWQHVLEPLYGYLILAEQLLKGKTQYASAWNFGPSRESFYSVEEVIQLFCKCWQSYASQEITSVVTYESLAADSAYNIKEREILALDSSKAGRELGWKIRWGMTETIKATVKIYQAWPGGKNSVLPLVLEQIDSYLSESREEYEL